MAVDLSWKFGPVEWDPTAGLEAFKTRVDPDDLLMPVDRLGEPWEVVR